MMLSGLLLLGAGRLFAADQVFRLGEWAEVQVGRAAARRSAR
jgi:hypothetical protein